MNHEFMEPHIDISLGPRARYLQLLYANLPHTDYTRSQRASLKHNLHQIVKSNEKLKQMREAETSRIPNQRVQSKAMIREFEARIHHQRTAKRQLPAYLRDLHEKIKEE